MTWYWLCKGRITALALEDNFGGLEMFCSFTETKHKNMKDLIKECRTIYSDNQEKNQTVFGKWVVCKNGDMDYNNRYFIDHARLEENWIQHLSEKGWIDFNDFIPAYLQALQNANKKTITIKLY